MFAIIKNIIKGKPLPQGVGHLVWPLQYGNPCSHKGYIHPENGYRCRYCGVKLNLKVN